MRGLLDVPDLPLKKILSFLKPIDFCSLRMSCTKFQNCVDDYFRLHYFTREEWLDVTEENAQSVDEILKIYGKLVRNLKVRKQREASNLLLDVIGTSCCDVLKGLSLNYLEFYNIDMERFAEVFNNLETLELNECYGNRKYFEQFLLGNEYPNLSIFNLKDSDVETETVERFFRRKRNLKTLEVTCKYMKHVNNLLPLIVTNAADIEVLSIFPEDGESLLWLAQFKKLKRLDIGCDDFDEQSIIALIKKLSVNNQLEMFSIASFEFTNEFCDALCSLTNLKQLRIANSTFALNETKNIDILCSKLSKLETLVLFNCYDFPYRRLLTSACKSRSFRKFYVDYIECRDINFIKQMVKDFRRDCRDRRSIVAGDPLCIYVEEITFSNNVKRLLSQKNLKSIQKYGNIKISQTKSDVFSIGFHQF